jgi:hypothetical protein
MKTIVLICITGIILMASCKRTITCSDHYITPAFIGFNLPDLDSIIVRQYEKGGTFLQLIDTTQITSDTTFLKSTSSGDTIFVLLNQISGQEKYIFPDHDWQIYIPANNITFSISNIISPQAEYSCFKCNCWNPISSFVQNTQTVVPQINKIPNLGGDFYLTYIQR